MKDLKEKVNEYLTIHISEILQATKEPTFRWQTIANKIGKDIAGEYVRSRWRKLKEKEPTIFSEEPRAFIVNPTSKFNSLSGKEDKTKGTKEFHFTADAIPTEEEIISHFNIDTKKYRISQIWHKTTPSGKYSISVNLNAIQGIEAKNYEDKFEKFVENYNKTVLQNANKCHSINETEFGEIMSLISLSDLHIGNYQKADYIQAIKKTVNSAILTASNSGVKEFVILNTGDLLHTDSSKHQTWNNTQLDAQDSYEDSFVIALDLITSLIDLARTYIPNVTFVNVRGNHSFDSEYCMGEALKRIYKSDKQVNILNSKESRIYYKWKTSGFLFTHGDRAVERLPLLFATEGKSVFSTTDNHYVLLGHLHHSKSKQFVNERGEYAGIEVRVLGSPTSNDNWHLQNGFCENKKTIVSLMFTEEDGKFGEFTYKI